MSFSYSYLLSVEESINFHVWGSELGDYDIYSSNTSLLYYKFGKRVLGEKSYFAVAVVYIEKKQKSIKHFYSKLLLGFIVCIVLCSVCIRRLLADTGCCVTRYRCARIPHPSG